MEEQNRRWVASMPGAYERFLVPTLFVPYAADLARRVAARAPRRTLEIAAGTGALTRALLAAGVRGVTATDLNPGMVEAGQAATPGASWQQADATALPFGDDEFDVVVCQFGAMFFPDKPAAFAEAARVLAPGGAFLFNVWDTVETHAFDSALRDALHAAYPDDPPTFMESVPHGYADPKAIEADLRAGGFAAVASDRVVLMGESESAEAVARGFCEGTPARAEIEARGGDLDAMTEAVAAVVRERLGTGAVRGEMAAYVFEASA